MRSILLTHSYLQDLMLEKYKKLFQLDYTVNSSTNNLPQQKTPGLIPGVFLLFST